LLAVAVAAVEEMLVVEAEQVPSLGAGLFRNLVALSEQVVLLVAHLKLEVVSLVMDTLLLAVVAMEDKEIQVLLDY
jgi:hypothetical protein